MSGILVESISKTFKTKGVKILGGITIATSRDKPLKALDGISLQISPGESVGIIGPNGAGKSTLMGCLLGFIQPDSGSVNIDGKSPNALSIRRIVGYVPERLNFHESMTIKELLHFHYQLSNQPESESRQRVEELLTMVGLEKQKWDLAVGKCSRGMLQRIAIAQALIGNPQYLLLDEPTSGIDPGGVLEITKLLLQIKQRGITMVLNSHQLDQVEKLCDRIIFVNQGRLRTQDEASTESIKAHAIKIRFSRTPPDLSQQLQNISEMTGLKLESVRQDTAEFLVSTDEDSEKLILELVTAKLPVVEATPQHSKLEKMFIGTSD